MNNDQEILVQERVKDFILPNIFAGLFLLSGVFGIVFNTINIFKTFDSITASYLGAYIREYQVAVVECIIGYGLLRKRKWVVPWITVCLPIIVFLAGIDFANGFYRSRAIPYSLKLKFVVFFEVITGFFIYYIHRLKRKGFFRHEGLDKINAHVNPNQIIDEAIDLLRLRKGNNNEIPNYIKKMLFPLILILSLIAYNNFFVVLLILPALFLHEIGHVIFFFIFKYKLKALHFLPFGLAVEADQFFKSRLHEGVIALAGPLMNFILGGVALVTFRYGEIESLSQFANINFMLCLINLLPIFPLDGGRILQSVAYSGWKVTRLLDILFGFIILLITAITLKMYFLLLFIFTYIRKIKLVFLYNDSEQSIDNFAKNGNNKKECLDLILEDTELHFKNITTSKISHLRHVLSDLFLIRFQKKLTAYQCIFMVLAYIVLGVSTLLLLGYMQHMHIPFPI